MASPWATNTVRWTNPNHARDLIRRGTPVLTAPSLKRVSVKIRPTTLAYVPRDREEFCGCQYDLGEIGRASDTEMMVSRSFAKHTSLCLKEGWKLIGKEPRAVAYIRKRLFEFELGSGIPFSHTLRETLCNIVTYGNAFVVFRRDPQLSSGRPYRKFGRTLDPVAGIFHADPSSMNIRRNRWGEVKGYEQIIEGDNYLDHFSKKFVPEDVYHVTYDKKSGFAWGTPFVVPVLDDIRLLRNMEELANLISHKATFPLIHWKVGLPDRPAIDFQDGDSEVTQVESELMGRDSEGVFVTSERHDIDVKELRTQDVTKALKYFRNRAMTGLNLSTVDLGEGETANRSTAAEMSKGLIFQAQAFQEPVATAYTMIFDDLLMEGGFQINDRTRVCLVFPEIDVETQQIVNNHAMALYQGHSISEDEMRMRIGLEPVTDEQRPNMFLNQVEVPKLEATEKAKAAFATTPAQNATANRNRPTNQSGTKGARGRTKNDLLIDYRLHRLFTALHNRFLEEMPAKDDITDKMTHLVLSTVQGLMVEDKSAKIVQICRVFEGMRKDTVILTLSYALERLRYELVSYARS